MAPWRLILTGFPLGASYHGSTPNNENGLDGDRMIECMDRLRYGFKEEAIQAHHGALGALD